MAKHAHSTTAPARRRFPKPGTPPNPPSDHAGVGAEFAAGLGPAVYAMVATGNCMSPVYEDGALIIASSTAECRPGDDVIVHIKPEFVRPGDFEALVKRLKFDLHGAKFPWDPTGSDVVIPVMLESLNPPRTYRIPYTHVAAVHKVLGTGKPGPDGQAYIPKHMLEAAQ